MRERERKREMGRECVCERERETSGDNVYEEKASVMQQANFF